MHFKTHTLIHFLLIPLLFLSSCVPSRKIKPTDPHYVSRKERRKKRKENRIIARYQMHFDQILKKYTYETRLLAKLENPSLLDTKKEEKLAKDIKKIICLKSHGAYHGANYGPFLNYKESLEHDMQELNHIAAQLDVYDFDSQDSIIMQEQIINLLASLDHIFDAIYLDFEVVRDLQLNHMAGQISSLQSEKYKLQLELALSNPVQEKSEKSVTVVINNTTPEAAA